MTIQSHEELSAQLVTWRRIQATALWAAIGQAPIMLALLTWHDTQVRRALQDMAFDRVGLGEPLLAFTIICCLPCLLLWYAHVKRRRVLDTLQALKH